MEGRGRCRPDQGSLSVEEPGMTRLSDIYTATLSYSHERLVQIYPQAQVVPLAIIVTPKLD